MVRAVCNSGVGCTRLAVCGFFVVAARFLIMPLMFFIIEVMLWSQSCTFFSRACSSERRPVFAVPVLLMRCFSSFSAPWTRLYGITNMVRLICHNYIDLRGALDALIWHN